MRVLVAALTLIFASPTWAVDAVIIDADTIQLGDTRFRFDGIDAPEKDQMCLDENDHPWACGTEARDFLINLIGKREVHCQDTGADTVYGRRVGICRVDGESMSLNQLLVRDGMALNFEPYAKGRFIVDEAYARDNRRGLWKGCFATPQEFRRWNKKTAAFLGPICGTARDQKLRDLLFPDDPLMPSGCSIKGKYALRAEIAGSRGIYHTEGCRNYARLKKPNRWFCSEQEAQDAGFRKAYTSPAGKRRR